MQVDYSDSTNIFSCIYSCFYSVLHSSLQLSYVSMCLIADYPIFLRKNLFGRTSSSIEFTTSFDVLIHEIQTCIYLCNAFACICAAYVHNSSSLHMTTSFFSLLDSFHFCPLWYKVSLRPWASIPIHLFLFLQPYRYNNNPSVCY